MPYNTKDVIRDSKGNPVPQKFNPATDSFEPMVEKEFYGNSTDTKPTNVVKGSTFYEFNTGDA